MVEGVRGRGSFHRAVFPHLPLRNMRAERKEEDKKTSSGIDTDRGVGDDALLREKADGDEHDLRYDGNFYFFFLLFFPTCATLCELLGLVPVRSNQVYSTTLLKSTARRIELL